MGRVIDMVAYGLLRAAWALGATLPLAVTRGALEGLGSLASRVDARHRRVIDNNLRQAFPSWDATRRNNCSKVVFRSWGRMMAELMHSRALMANGSIRGVEKVAAAVDELAGAGNGVLILTAHSANFELMARAVGNSGVAMSAFYRPMRNRLINDFLLAQRSEAGVSSVGRGSALREIVSVLAAGGVVAAPLDQNQGHGRGVFVDFFGRPACTSTMLARLSLASSAPVLPVFASWDSDGLVIDVRPAVHPPLSPADRRQAAVDLTGSYTELVEQQVRSRPEQWNWAHRRWKTRPAAETAAAE
ncbi:MAG: hypothetical protein HRT46_05700 [Deltaproteobacteria bacterium]|nr:hypothetical protein [Deltaproteobacteria bacterium]